MKQAPGPYCAAWPLGVGLRPGWCSLRSSAPYDPGAARSTTVQGTCCPERLPAGPLCCALHFGLTWLPDCNGDVVSKKPRQRNLTTGSLVPVWVKRPQSSPAQRKLHWVSSQGSRWQRTREGKDALPWKSLGMLPSFCGLRRVQKEWSRAGRPVHTHNCFPFCNRSATKLEPQGFQVQSSSRRRRHLVHH